MRHSKYYPITRFCSHRRISIVLMFTAAFFTLAYSGQKIIAVVNLVNKGGIEQNDIKRLCDTLASEIEKDTTLLVFDRAIINYAFVELPESQRKACLEKSCLLAQARMLAAQKLVGGRIKRENDKISIELVLLDTQKEKIVNRVSLTTAVGMEQIVSSKAAIMAQRLMSLGEKRKKRIVKGQNRKKVLVPTLGLVAAGAAGAAVYFLIADRNGGKSKEQILSLDDAPVHER